MSCISNEDYANLIVQQDEHYKDMSNPLDWTSKIQGDESMMDLKQKMLMDRKETDEWRIKCENDKEHQEYLRKYREEQASKDTI